MYSRKVNEPSCWHYIWSFVAICILMSHYSVRAGHWHPGLSAEHPPLLLLIEFCAYSCSPALVSAPLCILLPFLASVSIRLFFFEIPLMFESLCIDQKSSYCSFLVVPPRVLLKSDNMSHFLFYTDKLMNLIELVQNCFLPAHVKSLALTENMWKYHFQRISILVIFDKYV